jgi:hypothetical protein
MSDGRAWEGNSKARLYERVRERGYDSLTAFAEARPTASLVALAEELGKDDIAAVQVFSGLVACTGPCGTPLHQQARPDPMSSEDPTAP